MTQTDRVLAALRRRGPLGLTQIDFDPPTIDGASPIKRVAARVEELRRGGYQIDSSGRRNRCAVYRLEGVRAAEASEGPGREPVGHASVGVNSSSLFDASAATTPPARLAVFDDWEDAA